MANNNDDLNVKYQKKLSLFKSLTNTMKTAAYYDFEFKKVYFDKNIVDKFTAKFSQAQKKHFEKILKIATSENSDSIAKNKNSFINLQSQVLDVLSNTLNVAKSTNSQLLSLQKTLKNDCQYNPFIKKCLLDDINILLYSKDISIEKQIILELESMVDWLNKENTHIQSLHNEISNILTTINDNNLNGNQLLNDVKKIICNNKSDEQIAYIQELFSSREKESQINNVLKKSSALIEKACVSLNEIDNDYLMQSKVIKGLTNQVLECIPNLRYNTIYHYLDIMYNSKNDNFEQITTNIISILKNPLTTNSLNTVISYHQNVLKSLQSDKFCITSSYADRINNSILLLNNMKALQQSNEEIYKLLPNDFDDFERSSIQSLKTGTANLMKKVIGSTFYENIVGNASAIEEVRRFVDDYSDSIDDSVLIYNDYII